MLEWGNDVGVDGHVHEVVLNLIEVVSKDEVGTCDAHVTVDSGRGEICIAYGGREDVG